MNEPLPVTLDTFFVTATNDWNSGNDLLALLELAKDSDKGQSKNGGENDIRIGSCQCFIDCRRDNQVDGSWTSNFGENPHRVQEIFLVDKWVTIVPCRHFGICEKSLKKTSSEMSDPLPQI